MTDVAYVTVASTDIDRTAAVLGRAFGLAKIATIGDASIFAVGKTFIAVAAAGAAIVDGDVHSGVHHIAFAASDPAASARLAARQLGCDVSAEQSDFDGSRRLPLPAEATEGVRVYLAQPLWGGCSATSGGLIERIDHLGIVSPNTDGAIDVFHNRLGLPLESRQIDVETHIPVESFTSDKYGAVYHNRQPVFRGGVRSAFITAGDFELEFLQDYNPLGPGEVDSRQAGTTQQDRGAIARFLASRGPGLAHIALKTPDIARALAAAKENGCELIDAIGRPGGRRSQIAFIHPRSTGGILFHFVQRE